jgi:hypothetical protein
MVSALVNTALMVLGAWYAFWMLVVMLIGWFTG